MNGKTLKFEGKTLEIHTRDDGDKAIAGSIFTEREYRPSEEVIRQAKHSILDIGAHAGFFSLMAATLNPAVPVFAFEPHPENFAQLKEHLKVNRVRNVTPRQLAVNDAEGTAQMHQSREGLNHSLIKAIEPLDEMLTVQTTTLEKIFRKNRLASCDLLKLDCEGSEVPILESAPKEILHKIKAIILEYHEWDPSQKGNADRLIKTLRKAGFTCQKFPNSKIPALGMIWARK